MASSNRRLRRHGLSRKNAQVSPHCIDEGDDRIPSGGEEMKTMEATHLLETYRDVVARLHNEAAVPTADAVSSDFLDLAQSVEHQELARLAATRLAERARRLHIALTRVADGGYGVCSECGPPFHRDAFSPSRCHHMRGVSGAARTGRILIAAA